MVTARERPQRRGAGRATVCVGLAGERRGMPRLAALEGAPERGARLASEARRERAEEGIPPRRAATDRRTRIEPPVGDRQPHTVTRPPTLGSISPSASQEARNTGSTRCAQTRSTGPGRRRSSRTAPGPTKRASGASSGIRGDGRSMAPPPGGRAATPHRNEEAAALTDVVAVDGAALLHDERGPQVRPRDTAVPHASSRRWCGTTGLRSTPCREKHTMCATPGPRCS